MMKVELRNYLETQAGLNRSATEPEAWVAYKKLEGEKRDAAKAIRQGLPPDPPVDPETPPTEPSAADAVVAERARGVEIREMFQGDFPELQQTAIDEGWNRERSAIELNTAIRKERTEPVGAAPFIHARGSDMTINVDSLQGAMLVRSNIALDSKQFSTREARGLGLPDWLRADINSDERQRTMEAAEKIGAISMVDMCRMSLQVAGKQPLHGQDDMIRQAFEQGTLEPLFTTNFNSMLLAGYVDAPDSTVSWTAEEDFANFLQADLTSMGKFGALKRHAKKIPADELDVGATSEPIQLARYDGQFSIDEIDIINDRFGAISQMSPGDMGASARQLRPDLVYSILLSNPDLTRDDVAIFAGANNNDYTGPTSAMSVEAVEQLVAGQLAIRQRGRPLNLATKFILVPSDLIFLTGRTINSQSLSQTGATDPVGIANQLATLGLVIVPEARLGLTGVVDPTDDTVIPGIDTQWFGVAAPGAQGAKTITVGFRRGTGRAPVVRSFNLDKGKWGIGWDVNMDIAAAAVDRIAMARSGSSVA